MRLIKNRPLDASSSGNTAASTAGNELLITFPATTGNKRWHLSQVIYSVHASPSSQSLRVFDGTSSGPRIFDGWAATAGINSVPFPPLRGSKNSAMTIILSSGSTQQTLNAYGYQDD